MANLADRRNCSERPSVRESTLTGVDFSPSPDGQRFLLNVLEKNQAPPVITVIVNWPSLLGK